MDVPEDYAAFVAAHGTRLATACRALTGNSHLADSVARDLLAMVALRWRWLRRSGRAGYLDRLVRREARAWRVEVPRAERTTPRRGLLVEDEPAPTGRMAVEAWAAARSMRTRRAVAAAVALVMLLCFAALGPRDPTVRRDALPIPTRDPVPAGVTVLPPFTLLGGLWPRETPLPVQLPVDPEMAAGLSASPVAAAVAVLRQDPRPLLVVAADGSARRVDDPAIAGARLLPTSLSPDGRRVALLTPEAVRVIDVTTGRVRSIAVAQTATRTLAWRDARTVLVPGPGGAAQVNVDTGAVSAVPAIGAADVAAGSPSGPLVEMLGFDSGQPPRIRVWRTDPADARRDTDDRPIFGPRWVGLWRGQGWSTVDLLARACDPAAIPMPDTPARAAVVAIRPNGVAAGTLVSLDATGMDIVGFADDHTVLVNVGAAPDGSIVLAWNTASGEVRRATTRNPYLQMALADLRPARTDTTPVR